MADDMSEWLGDVLPGINAGFNALSTLLLLVGYVAIRRRAIGLHWRAMLAAVCSSALFLVGYLTRMALTGTHRFPAVGSWQRIYLIILFSHMVLAVAVVPLLLRTLWLAKLGRFADHRRIARVAWPIWLYVSVTGVVVYWMLYHLAPQLALAQV